MGEELDPKSIKTKTVRTLQQSASSNTNIPGRSSDRAASRDSLSSLWWSPSFSIRSNSFPASHNSTESEEEIQVINLEEGSDNKKPAPIELLFPSLKQEGLNPKTLTKSLSPTDLTKLLLGHQAKFTNLYTYPKRLLRRNAVDLSPLMEVEELSSEESLNKHKAVLNLQHIHRPRSDSADADISDNDEKN